MKGANNQRFPFHKWLAGCLVLLFCPLCFGQRIKVGVINARDARPLQNAHVSVSLLYEQGAKTPERYESILRAETDTDGRAGFSLPQPLPTHVSIQVKFDSEHWRCACVALLATQDVLQKGVRVDAERDEKPHSSDTGQAKSGEILFYARPLTFFERILYPFVKQ